MRDHMSIADDAVAVTVRVYHKAGEEYFTVTPEDAKALVETYGASGVFSAPLNGRDFDEGMIILNAYHISHIEMIPLTEDQVTAAQVESK